KFCSMKISQEVRDYANNQRLDTTVIDLVMPAESIQQAMQDKSREFLASGSELYHPLVKEPIEE
ncbi:hypothetical protein J0673_24440, partial [Vibrio sp. Vb2736]